MLALARMLTLALAGTMVPAMAGGAAADTTSILPKRPSLTDSPGYVPPADTESASVRLGRRPNAPAVGAVFEGGLESLDSIGRAVCHALQHRDADTLLALTISEREFRDILWREFPQSRPATGLTWQDGWTFLYARLTSGRQGAVGDYGGDTLRFVRWDRTDTTAVYRNFKLHNGLVLVAKTPQGELRRYSWLRSVAERRGRFKIYSVTD